MSAIEQAGSAGTSGIYRFAKVGNKMAYSYLHVMPDKLARLRSLSKVCRICAAVSDKRYNLFHQDGLKHELVDKIHKYLPIKVEKNDHLPQSICANCREALLAWDELGRQARIADIVMRRRLRTLQPGQQQAAEECAPAPSADAGTTSKDGNYRFEETLSINSLVKNSLTNYFHSLNLDEDNSDFRYICLKCENCLIGDTAENLAAHLSSHHQIETQIQQCIENFIKENVTFEENLAIHDFEDDNDSVQEKHDVELPEFSCPYCKCIFSSPSRLVCHLGKHVDVSFESGVMCCDEIYDDKKSFVLHLQQRHARFAPAGHTCRACGFSAESNEDLQEHISAAHVEPTIPTEEVVKETKTKSLKYVPATCPKCNKVFSNKYNMLVHLKNHDGKTNQYTCEKCGKVYKSQGNLNYHWKVVHEGELRFVCSSCGEAFPTRTARDVHSRLHSGLRPYSCDYCGKAFRAKNTLNRHIEMHLDVRKYTCRLCSKKFRKKTHLKYHITTHERK